MKRFVHPFLAVSVALATSLSGQTNTPTLTVSSQPTNEGLIGLAVNFQLSQAAVGGERIVFELTSGTATAGVDFIPFDPVGIIDFEAGDVNQTQIITMIDDDLVESDETFNLVITDTTGLTVSSASTQLTILNDD